MAKYATPANWADSLLTGLGTGAELRDTFSKSIDKRKAAKVADTIAQESTKKLFDVEDKGPIGNWAWDNLGIGDAPKLTRKSGAAPAAPAAPAAAAEEDPPSAARAAAQGGTATAPEPEMLAMQEIGITPVKTVSAAPPAPMMAVPRAAEEDSPPSRYRKMVQQGVNV